MSTKELLIGVIFVLVFINIVMSYFLIRITLNSLSEEEKNSHLLWMVENMPSKHKEPGKYNRWLGFVQGGLWFADAKTINEMRNEVTNNNALQACKNKLNEIAYYEELNPERLEETKNK